MVYSDCYIQSCNCTSIGPYQPSLEVYFTFPQQLHILITKQPHWPNYKISEFKVNITRNNGSLLAHYSLNVNHTDTFQFNYTLPKSVIHACASLCIIASAVSPMYGESEASEVAKDIPRGITVHLLTNKVVLPYVYVLYNYTVPGNFSEDALNPKIFFYPNGTPFLSLTVQVH